MTTLREMLTALPPELVIADARSAIRATNRATGRRIAVLDDDPTGSQSVHDVSLVTALERVEYERALAEPGSVAFLLTNTRALDEPDAVALTTAVATDLLEVENSLQAPVTVVSRSDSTLRGHVVAEVRALDQVRSASGGRGYDGVLLVPAFFEAGRLTVDDVHWVVDDGDVSPAAETEFARDATFGYTARTLPDFIVEKARGTIERAAVASLSIDDIRIGGPERVAEILRTVRGGRFVVVNAASPADLEVVVLGLHRAEAEGQRFLHRCGPSFVRALGGIELSRPLTADALAQRVQGGTASGDAFPGTEGGPRQAERSEHGIVVAGSHVSMTTRQLTAARGLGGVVDIEVEAAELADPGRSAAAVAAAAHAVGTAIDTADVVLATSREVLRGADPDASLEIARRISSGLVAIMEQVARLRPAWVIAKGGITSHDVVQPGLGIRRGRVVGQVLPGAISVLLPEEAPPDVLGMPVVIFPGNVGGETALADTLALLRGAGQAR